MSSGKTMLIVNPVSGKGRAKSLALDIAASLGQEGRGVTVFVTGKRGDAMKWAEEFGADFDRIICTGGDGTINEVISGLMRLPFEKRPAIGYIPLGTTNDMASTFNIPNVPAKALDIIQKNEPHTIDIGLLGDVYFGYVAAFGAFTDVSFITPQDEKNALGYLAYLLEALGSLPRIAPYHAKVEYDDGVIEDDFIFGAVVNSTSVAGLVKLKPSDVSLNDGVFEVVLIKNPATVIELNDCVGDLLAKNFNTGRVRLLHTGKVSFSFDRDAVWTRDGEDGGAHKSVTAQNCHSAIRMIYCPKDLDPKPVSGVHPKPSANRTDV